MVKQKINTSKHTKLPYALGIIAVIVIVAVAYGYHIYHEQKPVTTVNQYTKGQVARPNGSSDSSNQSTNPPSGSKENGGSTPLVAPSGNFVSDHHPNLSGSPAPNSMTSVCNTSPGAKCQISFTNGNSTKSLPVQITDAGGATYWYWKLQDIGLTAGSWKISATSSSGNNSLSSIDPMDLVVSQ